MATPTYELIETTTLTASASSVSFTSITQDYRDLVLVFEMTPPGSGNLSAQLKINNDTGSNYSYVTAVGRDTASGTVVESDSGTLSFGIVQFGAFARDTDGALTAVQIMDYSATDKHKSWLSRSNGVAPEGAVEMIAGRWANTSAITSLELTASDFQSGSTFSLYGIAS